jgi:hypothetical protein
MMNWRGDGRNRLWHAHSLFSTSAMLSELRTEGNSVIVDVIQENTEKLA